MFCMCMASDRSSPRIENQGYRLAEGQQGLVRVKVRISKDGNAVGLTSMLDRRQLLLRDAMHPRY